MNETLVALLKQANSVLIVLGKNAKRDSFAAALALYLGLIQEGKMARMCTEAPVTSAQGLTGADKITSNLDLGGSVLKVSFVCKEDAINQVSYNTTDDRFNILIEPREGTTPIDPKQVQFSYTGGSVDAIIVIDTPALEQLGSIYLENPDIFAREKIVNIDRRFDNKQYGAFNVVEKAASSTSELVLQLLSVMRISPTPEIATNLYAGLTAATNNFSSFSTNAQSFDAAAQLLKAGARKQPTSAMATAGRPMPASMPARMAPPQPFFEDDVFMEDEEQPVEKKPPTDWLKPKLYKSSDTV